MTRQRPRCIARSAIGPPPDVAISRRDSIASANLMWLCLPDALLSCSETTAGSLVITQVTVGCICNIAIAEIDHEMVAHR